MEGWLDAPGEGSDLGQGGGRLDVQPEGGPHRQWRSTPPGDELAGLRREAAELRDKKKKKKKKKKSRSPSRKRKDKERRLDVDEEMKSKDYKIKAKKKLEDVLGMTGLDPDPATRRVFLRRAKRLVDGKKKKKKKKRKKKGGEGSSSDSESGSKGEQSQQLLQCGSEGARDGGAVREFVNSKKGGSGVSRCPDILMDSRMPRLSHECPGPALESARDRSAASSCAVLSPAGSTEVERGNGKRVLEHRRDDRLGPAGEDRRTHRRGYPTFEKFVGNSFRGPLLYSPKRWKWFPWTGQLQHPSWRRGKPREPIKTRRELCSGPAKGLNGMEVPAKPQRGGRKRWERKEGQRKGWQGKGTGQRRRPGAEEIKGNEDEEEKERRRREPPCWEGPPTVGGESRGRGLRKPLKRIGKKSQVLRREAKGIKTPLKGVPPKLGGERKGGGVAPFLKDERREGKQTGDVKPPLEEAGSFAATAATMSRSAVVLGGR